MAAINSSMLIPTVEVIGIIIFTIVGGLSFGWFKILKQTNALLKEQNAELKADNKAWQIKHSENESAIANLQGQLDVLKNIPLQNIDASLSAISKSNDLIVSTLQKSAVTLIGDTSNAAEAVREVRQDLRNN